MERVRIRFGRLDPHLLRPLLFLLFLPHQASIKLLLHLPLLWLLWQAAGIMLVPDPATIPSSALKQATPLYSSDQWLFLGWPVHLLISVLLMRPKLSPLSLLSFLYIRLACCVLCVDIVSFPLPVFRVRRLKAVPRAPAYTLLHESMVFPPSPRIFFFIKNGMTFFVSLCCAATILFPSVRQVPLIACRMW